MIACICGGVLEALVLVPLVGSIVRWRHSRKHLCCKKPCLHEHHDRTVHSMAEAPVQGCHCTTCKSTRAAKGVL